MVLVRYLYDVVDRCDSQFTECGPLTSQWRGALSGAFSHLQKKEEAPREKGQGRLCLTGTWGNCILMSAQFVCNTVGLGPFSENLPNNNSTPPHERMCSFNLMYLLVSGPQITVCGGTYYIATCFLPPFFTVSL